MPNLSEDTSLSAYSYTLPAELIATEPCSPRDQARLLFCRNSTCSPEDRQVFELPKILPAGSLMVINDTKVIPSRIPAARKTGGRLELLLIENTSTNRYRCKILNSKKLKPGEEFLLFHGKATGQLLRKNEDETCEILIETTESWNNLLQKYAFAPLPPYIRKKVNPDENNRREKDLSDYQTIFAQNSGAIAAPTAGLHFTHRLMKELESRGIEFVRITLHVGIGTFSPVKEQDITRHRMHEEEFEIHEEAAEKINRAKTEGRNIIAVGTTSVRTLESATKNGKCIPGKNRTDIFIRPGYRFQMTNGLMTNFHLPESSLLMLISAFYNRQRILQIYEHAIRQKYRFYSYGDACLFL